MVLGHNLSVLRKVITRRMNCEVLQISVNSGRQKDLEASFRQVLLASNFQTTEPRMKLLKVFEQRNFVQPPFLWRPLQYPSVIYLSGSWSRCYFNPSSFRTFNGLPLHSPFTLILQLTLKIFQTDVAKIVIAQQAINLVNFVVGLLIHCEIRLYTYCLLL